jgi:hypothetical protein
MKRSEMIERLHLIINSRLYQDYQFSTEELSDVLKEIEDVGMLPPAVEGSIKIEEGEDGELFIPIWKWENE